MQTFFINIPILHAKVNLLVIRDGHIGQVLTFVVVLEGVQLFGLVDLPPLDSWVPVDSRVR